MKTPDNISPRQNPVLPQASKKINFINPVIEKIYNHAELSRIRERVVADLKEKEGNNILILSPDGETGASLLVAALGYYTAYACRQKVLLIDCNMCRPKLHTFFDSPQSHGIIDLIRNNLSGRDIVKGTGTERLHIITTGSVDDNISAELRHFHIQNLFKDIQGQFDLIICDTSPVLQTISISPR
ncbi:AAA domain-containing protein [Candidatus Electrothrix marina]|uniref:AAA domain-containing protein n=1 Tax=Candidatus Electrothrix marina TaxID=1859130 RepID=A0A3S3SUN3_9BACT|nr:AAA domain-containing protein [Candidatus Electrothrix marina]